MAEHNAYWQKKLSSYSETQWAKGPNLFAETAEQYFPRHARVLEIGSGVGQDGRWFASKGHSVLQTDLDDFGFFVKEDKGLTWQELDLLEPWPFGDSEFDVVYAHLSLHYFSAVDLSRIMQGIHRSLKQDGVLAFLVNSINDPELSDGTEIEPGYRAIDGISKRFFSRKSLAPFTKGFLPILFDEYGETYKDREKGVRNLVRFVGTKWYSDYLNALPFVGAIVEKVQDDEEYILLQTRWMPNHDPVYSGLIEIPAGVLDSGYEDVFSVVKREVLEESGLRVVSISGEHESSTQTIGPDSVLMYESFAQLQVIKGQRPYVGSIFICRAEGELQQQESETRDPHWVKKSELAAMIEHDQAQFFPLHVPALRKYAGVRAS